MFSHFHSRKPENGFQTLLRMLRFKKKKKNPKIKKTGKMIFF